MTWQSAPELLAGKVQSSRPRGTRGVLRAQCGAAGSPVPEIADAVCQPCAIRRRADSHL